MSEPCDPDEAPEGYYAVPKPGYNHHLGNLCRQCDWRGECGDPETDLLAYGHRCMAEAVVARRDNKIYQRRDRSSVLFKRLPAEPNNE